MKILYKHVKGNLLVSLRLKSTYLSGFSNLRSYHIHYLTFCSLLRPTWLKLHILNNQRNHMSSHVQYCIHIKVSSYFSVLFTLCSFSNRSKNLRLGEALSSQPKIIYLIFNNTHNYKIQLCIKIIDFCKELENWVSSFTNVPRSFEIIIK